MDVSSKRTTAPLLALWDESQWWGLLLDHAVRSLTLPVAWVRSREIADGLLADVPPGALLVPGGWSKLKSESLGAKGRRAIREYVRLGGTYIGFCGGAALALSTHGPSPGLGLCPWGRESFSKRLPNFSGHMRSRFTGDPGFFPGSVESEPLLPVWWPSQFSPCPGSHVTVVASYDGPGHDFWVSDLKVSSLPDDQIPAWERCYRIKLRPETITGEPCIVSGSFGRGRYLLSYAHLETPESRQANALLRDLLGGICDGAPGAQSMIGDGPVPAWSVVDSSVRWDDPLLLESRRILLDLFEVGASNFLLFWRSSWLMGWRRGIPGPALNTLLAYVAEALRRTPSDRALAFWRENGHQFVSRLKSFAGQMTAYLQAERLARSQSLAPGHGLDEMRTRLVGTLPGYGGPYASLVGPLDELLWTLLDSSR
jgi:hypothetical protein